MLYVSGDCRLVSNLKNHVRRWIQQIVFNGRLLSLQAEQYLSWRLPFLLRMLTLHLISFRALRKSHEHRPGPHARQGPAVVLCWVEHVGMHDGEI